MSENRFSCSNSKYPKKKLSSDITNMQEEANLNTNNKRNSFTIAVSKDGRIRNFPISIRNRVSKIIYDEIYEYPNLSNNTLLNKINNILKNEESIDFRIKVNSERYRPLIENYFNDIIIIVREIFNYRKNKINLTHFSKRILKDYQLTTYKTYGAVYNLSRELIDFLDDFPDRCLNREKVKMGTTAMENKKKRKDLLLRESFEKYQKFAEDKGGTLKTSFLDFLRLINNEKVDRVKLEWTCDKYLEHGSFEASYNNLRSGSWCPIHFREAQKNWQLKRSRYSFDYLQGEAEFRGGQLLTSKEEYEEIIKSIRPSKALFKWACSKYPKHPFWLSNPHGIFIKNYWCPECAASKYEKICKWYFENIFKSKFQKKALKFLNLDLSNLRYVYEHNLEILDNLLLFGHFDGYGKVNVNGCEYILAFEYNGYQHYEFPNQYHKTREEYEVQLIRDSLKILICNQNNIVLIVFPYYISERMKDSNKIQNHIVKEFERKTNIRFPKIKQFEFCN